MAVALWQAPRRTLILGRDRVGYAPLHFTIDRAGRFVFASEYKALLALDTVDARPNRDAIQVLQSTKWVKPGATCLADVYPVAPGTWLEVDAERMHTARFWNIPVRVEHHDEDRHAAALRETFLETLRWQTEPYRRIGVSLSGGLDSAVMAAGARHVVGDKELHTFTAGLRPGRPRADERRRWWPACWARIHHPLVLSPGDLPGLLPWMVWHLEEPIGREDIAYLYVAAREAARHVDVILAGFGFDGLFAGLPRHRLVDLGLKIPLGARPAGGVLRLHLPERRAAFPGRPRAPAGVFPRQAPIRPRTSSAPRPLPPFVGFPPGRTSR